MHEAPNIAQSALAPNASLEFCLRLTRAYATLTRRLDNALSSVHGLSFGDFMILYYLGRCLLYTSPSPRDRTRSRMPSSA